MINLWTVLLKYKEIMGFAENFKKLIIPLSTVFVGEEKYQELQRDATLLKIIVLIDFGFAIIAAFGFTLSPEYFNTRTYLAVWLRENFPDYSEHILFFIHLSNFPVALMLCSLSIAMSYFGYSAVIQIIYLNQIIGGICDTKIPPDERYTSELYQRSVRTKLKMAIMMHGLAIR